MSDYIRADAWIGVCELIEELGGRADEVLAASGLNREDLQPVERYVPMHRFLATLNNAVISTGRADFGLRVGLNRHVSDLGVVGLALANCQTWREAVDVGARIGAISNPLATFSTIDHSTPGEEMIWIDDSAATLPHREQAMERMVTLILSFARSLVQPDLRPTGVHFRHPRIAPVERYVAAIGVEPEFGQPRTGLIVKSTQLDAQIPTSNTELGGAAIQYLEATGQIDENEFLRAARITARTLIELGEASPQALAQTIGVDLRTLQRRLKEEGSSPAGIFDQARRSFAQRLLADNLHSLAQISHLLGYATPDSFNRNCKRWFGDTPGNLRGKDFRDIG